MPFNSSDLSHALRAEAVSVRDLFRKTNTQLMAHPERHEATLGIAHAHDAIWKMLPWLSEPAHIAEWSAWAAKQFDHATPYPDGATPHLLCDVVVQTSSERRLAHILDGHQNFRVPQTCALWAFVRSARANDDLWLDDEFSDCVFVKAVYPNKFPGQIRFPDWDIFNELAEPLRKSRQELFEGEEAIHRRRASLDEFDTRFHPLKERTLNPHASFIVKVFDELDGALEVLRQDPASVSEAEGIHAVMRCVLDFNLLTLKVLGSDIDGLKYVTGEPSHARPSSSRRQRAG